MKRDGYRVTRNWYLSYSICCVSSGRIRMVRILYASLRDKISILRALVKEKKGFADSLGFFFYFCSCVSLYVLVYNSINK